MKLAVLIVDVDSIPAGYEDDDDDVVSFSFTGSNYNSALDENITINSMFQVLCTAHS